MNRTVTLVLGSGVAWGIAYAGVLKALEELEVCVQAVGGTSMGAMVGGTYAAGLDTRRILEVTGGLDAMQMARIFMPSLPHGGIVRNEGVRKFLKDILGTPNIEDLEHPFFSPTADIETGEEIILEDGSLVEAIVASVSIPVLFQPNFYRNRYLVDGGLVDPLPLAHARRFSDPVLGFTVIPEVITKQKQTSGGVMPFLEKLSPRERGDFLSKMLQDARKRKDAPGLMEVMAGMILISNREVIRRTDPDLLENNLIQLDLTDFGLFDFLKGAEIAEAGYTQTMEQRDRLIRIADTAAG